MKKHLFPIAFIAAVCLLSFGSCKKKSSSSTCTCKGKGVSGQNTSASISKADSGWSSLSAECASSDTVLKAFYGSAYGCHM